MVYLLVAIINAIYGTLLLLTLSPDTPGFYIVLIIGIVLAIIGLSGFILWIRMAVTADKELGKQDNTAIKNWFGLARSFDIVLVLGLIFRAFILQPFLVDGISMEPNFHDKEALLVDKLTYDFRNPRRGEVVIFKAPPTPQIDYIKRVVGVPGDTIIIDKGKVSISGIPITEPYVEVANSTYSGTDSSSDGIFRKTLKPGEFFVMGDNRLHSSDSRDWGVLPKVNIVGRALIVVYPFKDMGIIHNPEIKIDNTNKKSSEYLLPLHQLSGQNLDKIGRWQKNLAQFVKQ